MRTPDARKEYRLRFFFDAGSGVCFWTANDPARARFNNYPIRAGELPLPDATVQRIEELVGWYDRSLNWDYPPDPGPWRQADCDRFNAAVRDLLATVRQELGADFEIINEYREQSEDPDLDYYLRTGERPVRPKEKTLVEVSPTELIWHEGEGLVETLAWHELESVYVSTTIYGPTAPDVFWIFIARGHSISIPSGVPGEDVLLRRLQMLPGFDNQAMKEAMTSTTAKLLLCWKRS